MILLCNKSTGLILFHVFNHDFCIIPNVLGELFLSSHMIGHLYFFIDEAHCAIFFFLRVL